MRSSLRRRASLRTAFAAFGLGLTTLSAHPAAAQTTVYSNTTNFSGQGLLNAGATSAAGATTMLADDITPAAGFAGQAVTSFTFSFANFNAAAVAAAPTAYFYASDGANGGPGTLLTSIAFNPVTQAAGSIGLYTFTNAAGIFALPSAPGDYFWAGLSFSGAGTNTTLAQLNNLGQGLFDPPTVGSSQDVFFASDNPVTAVSNPVGGLFFLGAAGPVSNLGWRFQVAPTPAPEASTTVSLGLLLALGMGGLLAASKRKRASASA